MWVRNGVFALVAIVALGTGVMLATRTVPDSATQYIQSYPQPRPLKAFSLTDQHGQPLGPEQLKGHWTLVFIGYTYCPDVCPTTLAKLNQIYPQLSAQANRFPLQVLFISIDPKRDTIAHLAEYIHYFNPHFIAATASHKILYPLVRQLGLMYSMTEGTDKEDYKVAHSSSVVVINPASQIVGRFRASAIAGQPAVVNGQHVLTDMPKLMATY